MQSARLLILDDDLLTGQTILNIAKIAGVEARFTDNPIEFFQWVHEWQPDFIALDLVMPRMDGVQVMVELARLRCRASIIITSGVGGRVLDAAARSASEHGLNISGILPKPFSPARLKALLSPQAKDTHANTQTGINEPATTQSTATAASETGPTAAALAKALDHQELSVVYQPKVNCRTGLLAGFEALARWQSPALGQIAPDIFIPLAEQSGLIDALTAEITTQAITWFAALPQQLDRRTDMDYLRRRLGSVTLSINISSRSLGNLALFEQIESLCERLGIRPERLIFELTETSAMQDPVSSLGFLTRLRMKGFHLSIDDFGTGYSSMLQLARLPFSEIKIDKSFVMSAGQSKESRTVIKTITDLGHGLGLYTSAEGIENTETLEYLRLVGCDLAQGYAIARPMTAAQVLAWLDHGRQHQEDYRLQLLHSMHILDSPADERFDRVTRLAARLFNVPISLFSLVDADRQWFKSKVGLDVRQTPRDVSFCSHAIQDDEIMVVRDATQDERFKDNLLVTADPHIRFYAGCPVHADTGSRLGTLCLIDKKPRDLSSQQGQLLQHLARMIENELNSDYLAHIDPLTRLLNRRGFEARADDVLTLCNHAGLSACLFLFDLVDFKDFNEQHGPAAGDRMLIEFCRHMKDTFRGSDLIARYGDDDFIVLMVDVADQQPDAALQRFRNAMQGVSRAANQPYRAGWTLLQSGDDIQHLVLRASENMHQCTESGNR